MMIQQSHLWLGENTRQWAVTVSTPPPALPLSLFIAFVLLVAIYSFLIQWESRAEWTNERQPEHKNIPAFNIKQLKHEENTLLEPQLELAYHHIIHWGYNGIILTTEPKLALTREKSPN